MTWQWRWFTLIEVGRSERKKSWNVNRFLSEQLSTHKVGKKSWKVYFTLDPQYTKEQKLGRPYYYTTIWFSLFNLSYGIYLFKIPAFLCKNLILNLQFSTFLSLNPSDAEVDQLKKEIDEDDSGDIDFDEFLELMNSTTLRYSNSHKCATPYFFHN